MKDFTIRRVTDPKEGPIDGVSAETVGVYTKFRGKGLFQAEKRIIKQETTDVGIKAAVSTGVVSIYDRKRDYGIAVPITELAAILNEALRVGMTGGENHESTSASMNGYNGCRNMIRTGNTSSPVFLEKISATRSSSRCPTSLATQLLSSSS